MQVIHADNEVWVLIDWGPEEEPCPACGFAWDDCSCPVEEMEPEEE